MCNLCNFILTVGFYVWLHVRGLVCFSFKRFTKFLSKCIEEFLYFSLPLPNTSLLSYLYVLQKLPKTVNA